MRRAEDSNPTPSPVLLAFKARLGSQTPVSPSIVKERLRGQVTILHKSRINSPPRASHVCATPECATVTEGEPLFVSRPVAFPFEEQVKQQPHGRNANDRNPHYFLVMWRMIRRMTHADMPPNRNPSHTSGHSIHTVTTSAVVAAAALALAFESACFLRGFTL